MTKVFIVYSDTKSRKYEEKYVIDGVFSTYEKASLFLDNRIKMCGEDWNYHLRMIAMDDPEYITIHF